MTRTELPRLFFGRLVRPYALAVMYSTFVISWTLLVTRNGPGAALDRSLAGQAVGIVGMLAVVLLIMGFIKNSDEFMMAGMLLTTGAWCARGIFILLDQGFVEASALSFGWVLASMGAFFLEFLTGDRRIREKSRV
jgi:hypothetical protein